MNVGDSNRLFLLSLASLSVVGACTDNENGKLPSQTPITVDDDDHALPYDGDDDANGPAVTVCRSFALKYVECYEPTENDYYGYGGIEGEPADYLPYLEAQCEAQLAAAAEVSPICSTATVGVFVCASSINCAALGGEDPCVDELTRAALACDPPQQPGGDTD